MTQSDVGAGATGHSDRIGREFYDSEYFQRGAHLTDPSSRFHRYRARNVLRLVKPRGDERVVDLGCGWGTITFALGPNVGEIVGVDYSERSIEICRARLAEEPRPNVRFKHGDARSTELATGTWDVVVAADLYEHLNPDDAESVTKEAFRLLRGGGRLVIWTPHRGHLLEAMKNRGILMKPDPSHVDYKSPERLRELVASVGFNLRELSYAPSHLPGLSAVEKVFQGVVPWLRRRICVGAERPG